MNAKTTTKNDTYKSIDKIDSYSNSWQTNVTWDSGTVFMSWICWILGLACIILANIL